MKGKNLGGWRVATALAVAAVLLTGNLARAQSSNPKHAAPTHPKAKPRTTSAGIAGTWRNSNGAEFRMSADGSGTVTRFNPYMEKLHFQVHEQICRNFRRAGGSGNTYRGQAKWRYEDKSFPPEWRNAIIKLSGDGKSMVFTISGASDETWTRVR